MTIISPIPMPLLHQAINTLDKHFRHQGLYRTTQVRDRFCVHVNALMAISFASLGMPERAKNIADTLLQSKLYNAETHLFHREIALDHTITDEHFNVCKNALVAIALAVTGKKKVAREVITALHTSPLYDHPSGLFHRQFSPSTGEVNRRIVAQTNLWMVMSSWLVGMHNEARELVRSLEIHMLDRESGLFFSQDGEAENPAPRSFYSDDQALAVIAYVLMNDRKRASQVMNRLLESELYDEQSGLFYRDITQGKVNRTITAYKNALCGIALGMTHRDAELARLQLSLVKKLYDLQANLFQFSDHKEEYIPDNSLLALVAISEPRKFLSTQEWHRRKVTPWRTALAVFKKLLTVMLGNFEKVDKYISEEYKISIKAYQRDRRIAFCILLFVFIIFVSLPLTVFNFLWRSFG